MNIGKESCDIRTECLIKKLCSQGKTGIKLPIKKVDADREIDFLNQLFIKGLVSSKTVEERKEEINSRSLDEETYKEFFEAVSLPQEK